MCKSVFPSSVGRLLAFFIVLLTSVNGAFAQRYDFLPSSGTFTPLSSATTITFAPPVDDVLSGVIPIGFSFTYFGTTYTDVKVSTNGFITFNTASALTDFNNKFGDASTGNLKAAPLWDDLGLGGGIGTVSHKTEGSVGTRIFTVEWFNWKWQVQSVNPTISFQVKLYETTNVVQFVYKQEAGIAVSPTASIGLVGAVVQNFYSLSNSSPSPVFDPAGINNISAKPTTGQTYTFTPNAVPNTEPVTQANTITAPNTTGTTMTLAWTNGSGDYRAVFMKQTAAVESPTITDNTSYLSAAAFGTATSSAGGGWFCVYNGTANTVVVTALTVSLTYRIQVMEYNGLAGSQNYNTTTATGNPANIVSVLGPPSAPISTLKLLRVSSTQVTFDLEEQSGEKRAVFMRATSSGTSAPVNDVTYTANTVFGSGTQIGSSGWFCVFNGVSGSNLTITGLTGNTAYRIHVVDYNGAAGTEKYFSSTDPNNPVQFTTFVATALPTYTFAPSSGTFTPIAGGTAVNTVEADDALSAPISIGFAFTFAGTSFTDVIASSNGFLTFNPYAANNLPTESFTNSLTSSLSRPLVAPLWDDLSGVGGQASYLLSGSAPNRIFTFEFINWKWQYNAAAAGLSFQVKLYETTDKVEFVYRQEAGALSTPSASIGMAFPDMSSSPALQSLNNSGAGPGMNTIETSSIATKPATNQVYAFTPTKLDQTITFGALAAKTFGDPPFGLTGTASSGLTVTYLSSNTAVATVSGSTVTIEGAGTTTITADQAGNGTYNPAPSVPQSLTVNKANQTITFGALAAKTFGDPTFGLTGTASSGLAVSYNSSNTLVATVSGSTVTIVGAGSTTITASQGGNINYNAATSVPQTLVVSKANQTITFGALAGKTFGDIPFVLTGTASSGLAVSYGSPDTSVATISGNTVTIVGAGSATITASQAGNANYNAATSVPQTLVVSKANQTITFGALAGKNFGDTPFDLTATANSGLPVSYGSSDTNVATISGSMVTIAGVGSTTITASQAGNANYNAATNVQQTLVVSKGNQTITFDPLPQKNPGDPPFNLAATASSGLTVSFSSSNTAVATIIGNTVTIVGSGTTDITASQGGNANYNAAPNVVQPLAVKLSQTITFGALPAKTIQDADFTLTATASSGLPITYFSTDGAVASITGAVVEINGVGTTTIQATQAGDGTYHPAVTVEQVLTVNKVVQVITFTAPSTKTLGDPAFSLSATSTSSLAVSFSTTSDKVTISGSQVTLVKAGSVTISAVQAGDGVYLPATPVDRTFCINPVKPVISITGLDSGFPVLNSSSTLGNQWLKDGVEISGATAATFTPSAAGVYTLVVKVDNCSSEASVPQTLVVTGLQGDLNSLVKIYPNPVQNELVVDVTTFAGTDPATVSMYNLSGQVLESVMGKGLLRMNLGSYAPGNYFVLIKSANRIATRKITKH